MAQATAVGGHPLQSPTTGGATKTISLLQLSHRPCRTTTNLVCTATSNRLLSGCRHTVLSARRLPLLAPCSSSSASGSSIFPGDEEDGVLLGTLKLPQNTDLPRFETLLFQWANSLCQGANLPIPVPLKVDRVKGGARLGFAVIGDGKTETPVYIDCLVFPADATGGAPMFRAIRNGPSKENEAPGEPRIMRSLLQALQKSTEIARL